MTGRRWYEPAGELDPAGVMAWLGTAEGLAWQEERALAGDGGYAFGAWAFTVKSEGQFSVNASAFGWRSALAAHDPAGRPPAGHQVHPRAGYWRARTGPAGQAEPANGKGTRWAS